MKYSGAPGMTSPDELARMDALSRTFGRSMSDAFAGAIVHGKRFDEVLKSIGTRLENYALKAAFKPVEQILSTGLDTVLGRLSGAGGGQGLASLLGSLMGSAGTKGPLDLLSYALPHARGGVVEGPSLFPMAGGLGLAGEAGAEAIMPLARGADGRLGVRGGGGRPVSVTVNVTTPDAESFRRSEAQVAAALARAVARGQRAT